MYIKREKITDMRMLALSFAGELLNVAHDLSMKALDTRNDMYEVISTLGNALDAIRDDTGEFYQERYEQLSEEFFKHGSIAE